RARAVPALFRQPPRGQPLDSTIELKIFARYSFLSYISCEKRILSFRLVTLPRRDFPTRIGRAERPPHNSLNGKGYLRKRTKKLIGDGPIDPIAAGPDWRADFPRSPFREVPR